jgi:hypothetical protein
MENKKGVTIAEASENLRKIFENIDFTVFKIAGKSMIEFVEACCKFRKKQKVTLKKGALPKLSYQAKLRCKKNQKSKIKCPKT